MRTVSRVFVLSVLFVMSVAHAQSAPDSALLALVPDSLRKPFAEALTDAGSNWPELAQAVRQSKSEHRAEAVWLILNMPHLDRLEMTSAILLEHIEYAHKSATAFRYTVPDSMFRDYLLAYRIADEPVTAWRRLLFERFAPMVKEAESPARAARLVNQWLARTLRKQTKGFFGPMKAPELTLVSRAGTQEEVCVLATAILKAIAIPSRRAKVPWLGAGDGDTSWVEILSEGRWLPLYPLDARSFGDFTAIERRQPHNVTIAVTRTAFSEELVTGNYTAVGEVNLHVTASGEPLRAFEGFSFNTFNLGAWRALDELNTVTDSLGNFRCRLGDGDYQLICGLRDPLGNPYIVRQSLTVKPEDTLHLNVDVTPPVTRMPRSVVSDIRFAAPLLDMDFPALNGGITSPTRLKGKTGLVVFFDPQDSASGRVMIEAESLFSRYKDKGFAVVGVGLNRVELVREFRDQFKLTCEIGWAYDPKSGPGAAVLTPLLDLDAEVKLPCVLLLDKTGKTAVNLPGAASLGAITRALPDLLK